jgi:outer membrane protein TolC
MKYYIINILILIPFLTGAQVLSLDSCLNMAEKNYPLLNKADLLYQTQELNNKIAAISNYPSLKLNASASWQTDVTQLEIDNPMFQDMLPEMSKDQYKVFAEFSQAIWDGGTFLARKEIEQAILDAGLSQIQMEIFTHKEKIVNIYFVALGLQKQLEILDVKKWQLEEVITQMRSALENEVITKAQLDILIAEKLILEQNITELQFESQYYIKLLGVYCGSDFGTSISLLVPTPEINSTTSLNRPELSYFDSQSAQIQANKSIIRSSRMPRVFAFAQAGYGRPGLNMMSNDFEPYAIVGAKLVWTPWEWNKSNYEYNLLDVKSSIVENSRDIFMMNQNAALEAQFQKIEKYRKISASDEDILELREGITKSYLAQLNSQVITSTDYLSALNEENSQRLKGELHQLMLYEAVVKYNLMKGEIYSGK